MLNSCVYVLFLVWCVKCLFFPFLYEYNLTIFLIAANWIMILITVQNLYF